MAIFTFAYKKMIDNNPANAQDVDQHIAYLSENIISTDVDAYNLFSPDIGDVYYSYENDIFLECVGVGTTKAWDFGVYSQNTPIEGTPSDPLAICLMGTKTVEDSLLPRNEDGNHASLTNHARQDTNYFGPDAGDYLPVPCNEADDQIDAVGERTEILVAQLKLLPGCPQGDLPRQYINWVWKSN